MHQLLSPITPKSKPESASLRKLCVATVDGIILLNRMFTIGVGIA